jgi:A/G-specific adenine glycosylase
MHKTAQIVANDFKGVFPNNYNDLLKLKGIGNYTAAAIASFSYNEVVPVVDGNVYRVLSRYFNIDSDISLPKTKKEFTNIAHELIPNDNPAMFNQAIMEFGAIQCVPKNPNCTLCIFNSSCAALQKNKIGQLPFKSKKIKVANRFFNYLVFHDQENATILRKRVENGIWHNLYEFPVIETNKLVDFETIKLEIENKFKQYSIDSISIFNEKPIIHKLSHQHLNICFYHIQLNDKLVDGITSENINNFPIPVVISNFIEKHLY